MHLPAWHRNHPRNGRPITQSGMDSRKIYTVDELVASDDIFCLYRPDRYNYPAGYQLQGSHAETHSLLIRDEDRRFIQAEYALESWDPRPNGSGLGVGSRFYR